MGAPAEVEPRRLKELHIRLDLPAAKDRRRVARRVACRRGLADVRTGFPARTGAGEGDGDPAMRASAARSSRSTQAAAAANERSMRGSSQPITSSSTASWRSANSLTRRAAISVSSGPPMTTIRRRQQPRANVGERSGQRAAGCRAVSSRVRPARPAPCRDGAAPSVAGAIEAAVGILEDASRCRTDKHFGINAGEAGDGGTARAGAQRERLRTGASCRSRAGPRDRAPTPARTASAQARGRRRGWRRKSGSRRRAMTARAAARSNVSWRSGIVRRRRTSRLRPAAALQA